MSPACHHYTSFLVKIGHAESLPIILAALLPCFWIYVEVGKSIKANSSANNPFNLWIQQYGGEEFEESTRTFINLIDKLAENVSQETFKKMLEVYAFSACLEYMFWEDAYQLKKWIQ